MNEEAVKRAEQAKSIIIEKIKDYLKKTNENSTIPLKYQKGDWLILSKKNIEECSRDIENKLLIVKVGSDCELRWNAGHISDTNQRPLMSKNPGETLTQSVNPFKKELMFVQAIINKSLDGTFTRLSGYREYNEYQGSVVISSKRIQGILEKYPPQPKLTNAKLY